MILNQVSKLMMWKRLNNLKKTDDAHKNIKESRILTEEEFNINNNDDIEKNR